MDVQTKNLNGYLKENIYMYQFQDFIFLIKKIWFVNSKNLCII